MLPNQQPLPGPPGTDTPSMATKAPPPPAPGGGPGGGPAPGGGQGPGDLGPQDAQALLDGISPPALLALKKMFNAIFDGMAAKQNAMKSGGGAPAPGAPPAAGGPQPGPNGAGGASPGPGGPPTPVAPGGLPRPGTRLGGMQ